MKDLIKALEEDTQLIRGISYFLQGVHMKLEGKEYYEGVVSDYVEFLNMVASAVDFEIQSVSSMEEDDDDIY
mgnify:CR=1 FL=1